MQPRYSADVGAADFDTALEATALLMDYPREKIVCELVEDADEIARLPLEVVARMQDNLRFGPESAMYLRPQDPKAAARVSFGVLCSPEERAAYWSGSVDFFGHDLSDALLRAAELPGVLYLAAGDDDGPEVWNEILSGEAPIGQEDVCLFFVRRLEDGSWTGSCNWELLERCPEVSWIAETYGELTG